MSVTGRGVVFKDGWIGISTSTGAATKLAGVSEIRFERSKASLNDGAMGDTLDAMVWGLETADIVVTARIEYGTDSIEELMQGYYANETPLSFLEVRPYSTAVSKDNPRYRASSYGCFDMQPVSGAHGERLASRFTFKPLSGATLVRATAT